MRNFANFFAIIFGQFVARKILRINFILSSQCLTKCNNEHDFLNKISGHRAPSCRDRERGEWHVEGERKSMTCYLGSGQTCHTCLIWHQGLHQRLSEIFDLSEDTFIVLFAKLSFQSRFWWNSAELQHEKECRARKLLNVFYN